MKWIFSMLMVIGFSVAAQAEYFQADLKSADEDPRLGVHLIIAGKGMEVGDQWLRAAHTQALLFKDRQDHGSIRIIAAIDNPRYEKMLATWGYSNVKVYKQALSDQRLIALLLDNEKIASMDFIGHNGAILGFALEDYDHRFFLNSVKALAPLKAKMGPDSFIRIMGCNTGWNLAPAMANTLGVPTAGSFTFADIQKLHQSNEWFYNGPGRYPGGNFATRNTVSFFNPVDCAFDGGCLRLKPVSINYQGKHGTYQGTLPFLKYFCGTAAQNDCARRVAGSTRFLVGATPLSEKPSFREYAATIAEHMCSSWVDDNKRLQCRGAVSNHLEGARSLPGNFRTTNDQQLSCDFQRCKFRQNCSSGTCVLEADLSTPSTAFVDELNFYKLGFELLSSTRK